MKRRDFLKNSALTVGLAGAPTLLLAKTKVSDGNMPQIAGLDLEEIRTSQYLHRLQASQFLPKLPEYVDAGISPMPLEERVRRKIVPQRGFCCLEPGGEILMSGNGAMNVELKGNPFTESIPFSHESLFTPRKKSLEAPKIASVLPQVRQMMLDGKYQEAINLALKEWQKNPITRGGMGGGSKFSMLLEFPKSEPNELPRRKRTGYP